MTTGDPNYAQDVQLQQLEAYLQPRRALVVDANSSNRKSTLKILSELGTLGGRLHHAAGLGDAREIIRVEKPAIVIADYFLNQQCGLDLTNDLRDIYPDKNETIFIVLAGKNLGVVKSHLMESDADGFIAKPYSADSFRIALHALVCQKLAPSAFSIRIDEGRALLAQGETHGAVDRFRQALQLNPDSVEAFGWLGQALLKSGDTAESYRMLSEGLKRDAKHYGCLHGMLDLLAQQGRLKDAHGIALAIVAAHPLNPMRLPQLVKLSVAAGAFDDIPKYAAALDELEEKPVELARSVAAGLFLAAKAFLRAGQAEKAADACHKAEVADSQNTELRRQMACELVRHGLRKDAQGLLDRLPPAAQEHDEYREACVHEALLLKDLPKALQIALDALRDGVKNPFIYTAAIQVSVEMKRRESVIEDLVQRAIGAFPEQREVFEKLTSKVK